ncbi:hypothetical protein ACFQFC_02680 [Amorphoplanes digitatis]|uniref:Uncharacterized protein n=1 Tax=Actinoplanes digitatis TaxID=1868 RepID=A0A7W7HYE6_9ACTN|nr:hypothetical protein [Actinoplanes digitatis]MBB4763082.1 hypothetical protein [Actinoplanes digitatis]BFE72080.1 hypothetical protein GCM10020092_053810 [Actinoplanes digitatis]GID97198.1 hypothetical protein Adi01nite_66100 [Actinoplanes digitatis]
MKIRTSLAAGVVAATIAAMAVSSPALASSPDAPSGHVASATTSAVTEPVYKVPHKPTITGKAKVGATLTAHISGLPKGAKVTYQWGEGFGQYGGPIGKPTTKKTLKVTKSMRGGRILVIATVTMPGYADGTATSAPTGKVK